MVSVSSAVSSSLGSGGGSTMRSASPASPPSPSPWPTPSDPASSSRAGGADFGAVGAVGTVGAAVSPAAIKSARAHHLESDSRLSTEELLALLFASSTPAERLSGQEVVERLSGQEVADWFAESADFAEFPELAPAGSGCRRSAQPRTSVCRPACRPRNTRRRRCRDGPSQIGSCGAPPGGGSRTVSSPALSPTAERRVEWAGWRRRRRRRRCFQRIPPVDTRRAETPRRSLPTTGSVPRRGSWDRTGGTRGCRPYDDSSTRGLGMPRSGSKRTGSVAQWGRCTRC
eukprot:500067-Prorocentrum_minimum.AAC.1